MEFRRDYLEDVAIITAVMIVSSIVTYLGKVNPTHDLMTQVIAFYEASIHAQIQNYIIPSLTHFFIFMYIVGFPTLLLGSYFYLKKYHEGQHYNYAKAYIMVNLISIPVFYFLPVTVTGHYLEGVDPIYYDFLFNNEIINQIVSPVDDFQKAFPSLHTGLSAVASLSIWNSSKKAGTIAWIITACIMASTIYLGIHWIADAVTGLILAYISYRLFH